MSRRFRWVGLVALATVVLACNSILGLTDFAVTPDPADATDETTIAPGDGSCAEGGTSDADLTMVCYPCEPLTTEQLLNACTGAQCVPFARTRLTNLLPDGGLPPLPPAADGG